MKKLLLGIFVLGILSLALVSSATQTITIDETGYKPSILYPSIWYGTGSQIWANVTITNSAGWNYVKRVELKWDGSSVGCVEKSYADNWKKYQCILTVTPTMNQPMDVFITSTDYDGDYSILWSKFAFAGQEFPQLPHNEFKPQTRNCTKITYCSKFEKVCHYDQICRKYDSYGNCIKYSKKKVCEYTPNCLSYKTKRVCVKNP